MLYSRPTNIRYRFQKQSLLVMAYLKCYEYKINMHAR